MLPPLLVASLVFGASFLAVQVLAVFCVAACRRCRHGKRPRGRVVSRPAKKAERARSRVTFSEANPKLQLPDDDCRFGKSVSSLQHWKMPAHYELKELLGVGAYGSVREAYDFKTQRRVAIKRELDVFQDLVICKRVLREVAILSRLKHPHIVELYEVVVPESESVFSEIYLVLELCDSDLHKVCQSGVVLSTPHVYNLLYTLLFGLEYLHAADICHRDLKPANCLVHENCEVKIADFGLARLIGQWGRNAGSGSNMTPCPSRRTLKRKLTLHVETRWYRAPEVILLQEYTEMIDIWSTGCIFAELLSMLDGSPDEPGPLFPGRSCFPLSPGRCANSEQEQLALMFDLLGTPSESDIENLDGSDAMDYVRSFVACDGMGLRTKFPHAPDDLVHLLGRMLCFNPDDRISVFQAVKHRVFSEIRHENDESMATMTPTRRATLDFKFEEQVLCESSLRRHFFEEISRSAKACAS